MQVRSEPVGLWVKDRVATDLRAAGRSEIKCETSLVHISWFVYLWCTFRTHVRAITADSCRIIQVLHWQLTLVLHECERLRLVTLRYCCLQKEKAGNVRAYNVILRRVRANIGGFRIFSEACQKCRFCMYYVTNNQSLEYMQQFW